MNQQIDMQRLFWDREVASFDSIYSGDKSRIGVFLDRVFRHDMYERFDYTMARAEPIDGRTFLDVGCGTGRYSLELARRGASRVVGLDISEKMIETGRARARQERVDDRMSFVLGDLLHYGGGERFDCSLAIGLLDYIPSPLPLLSKMKERTSGAVILSFPRRWTWRAPVRKLRLALKGCDVRFYTIREIDGLLRQAGFERYDFETVGQLFCVTAYV